MPTYEFRCPRGHEFEKLYRTISGAEAQARCPQCGEPAERVMSATGFAFKGSGFYLTDYGKNAHRGDKAAPAASAGEGSSSDSSTGDAKAKTEPAPSAGASNGGAADSKKPESKQAEAKPQPKADPKPAPAKKSSTE